MAFSFRAGTNWCHDFPKLARESGFHFNMHRRVRVDWNRISSIDVDRVIRERDFSTIDENVNNVVDYCLESEYDVKILDPNFVKLFRLAQLAVEYLLYCKQYLDHSVVILKDELRSKIEENSILKDEQNSSEKIIKQLKDKLKERSRIIESKLSDSHGEIHKCPQCPKTFISGLFMNAHVNRRHPHSSRLSSTSPVHEQYKVETEKLHSEIKTLKERLNLTERIIRNESEKLLTSESIVSNDNREMRTCNKSEQRNHQDRDERMEEQHRRYQEDIDNLKMTLFDEIRNLKMIERYPRERHEDDDNGRNVKEIVREQENEIKRLRQELCAKPKTDIEDEAKRDNHESLWQAKIDYLETRHRTDIEKLYNQLRVTQESADQMRVDYMTRLSDLERREANLESSLIQPQRVSRERSLSPAIRDNARHVARDKTHERSENPSISIEPRQNRFFIREKEQSRESKSDYVNDELREYQTDDSIQNGESMKILDGKERSKETTRESSSMPISSKNTHRTSNREQIESVIKNEDGGKTRKRWKVDRIDGTLRGQIDVLRNGSDLHRSTNSHTNEKQRTNKLESQGNSAGIFDSHYTTNSSSRKINEGTSIVRDVVPHGNRPKHQFFTRDSREKLPVEKINETAVDESRKNQKNREKEESESESEESESSLESESDNSTESQTEDYSEKRQTPQLKRQNDFIEKNLRDYEEEASQDTHEIFNSKLRDLGIDPEWRGVPNATFAQIMEIVRHHRNINSKKYRKFDEIRRKLLRQLARTLDKEKEGRSDDLHEQSPLEKLMTNVKSKVSKALNILEKNDGSNGNKPISTNNYTREKVELRKLSQDRSPSISSMTSQKEVRAVKSQYPKESMSEGSDEKLTSRPEQTTYERYGPIARRKQMENVFEPTEHKHLSNSYESIKDFLKDTNNRMQQKSAYKVSGTLVTSTPQKNAEIPVDLTSISNDASVRITKQESLLGLSNNSPRNSKSVLKSTNGSTGSLVKKKVLFDLESAESPEREIKQSMYSALERDINNDKKDTSESDFELSSIYDERDPLGDKDESQTGKIVLLKTSQSEKIAQISKQIEQQLSIARRKPVGAVEAMFMEKFLGNETRESTRTRLTAETPETLKQAVPTSWQNPSRRSSSLLQRSEIKDTNLDMDIDELLQME